MKLQETEYDEGTSFIRGSFHTATKTLSTHCDRCRQEIVKGDEYLQAISLDGFRRLGLNRTHSRCLDTEDNYWVFAVVKAK